MTTVDNAGDEDTPSLVVDNLRPDHVGGSAAMVIDGKDAGAPEARTWPNLGRWVAMCAVVAAARRVCVQQTAGNMAAVANTTLRAALDALDVIEGKQ